MENLETELTSTKRSVWNAGRTVGAKRGPETDTDLGNLLLPQPAPPLARSGAVRPGDRQQASGLRPCVDEDRRHCQGGQIRTRAIVMQQKTGRPVRFELLPDARASLLAWLERRGGTVDDYVFPSRVDYNGHLSTRQYARLVDEWVTGVGLMRSGYGTHSLRRTRASIIYRATGNLRAVQILLGHSKIENTVRYPGIDVEEALAPAENTEI